MNDLWSHTVLIQLTYILWEGEVKCFRLKVNGEVTHKKTHGMSAFYCTGCCVFLVCPHLNRVWNS